jgi:hypothetical protein
MPLHRLQGGTLPFWRLLCFAATAKSAVGIELKPKGFHVQRLKARFYGGVIMSIISFSRFGKYCLIGTFLLFMFLLLMPAPQAAAETMKFRFVFFHTKVETVEVGDMEGHNLYSGESTGLATLETGEVAVTTLTWVADYIKGTGISGVIRATDVRGWLYYRFER